MNGVYGLYKELKKSERWASFESKKMNRLYSILMGLSS